MRNNLIGLSHGLDILAAIAKAVIDASDPNLMNDMDLTVRILQSTKTEILNIQNLLVLEAQTNFRFPRNIFKFVNVLGGNTAYGNPFG